MDGTQRAMIDEPEILYFQATILPFCETRRDGVAIGRSIDVVLDVLFAGPDDFHRTVDLFGDAHRGRHHVGFEPAAETAAEQMVVHGHLVERQTRAAAARRLAARHDLGAGPYFAGVRA